MAKESKNLQKVQDMLDGNYKNKIIVGDHSVKSSQTRAVGERWTDAEGTEWEQREGYYTNVTKLASRGIADKCSDCESFIIKKWDKDSYKHNGRCYYCQIDFEAQYSRPIQTGQNAFKKFEGEKGMKKWRKLSREEQEKFLNENLNEHEKYQLNRIEDYIKSFKEEEKIWKKEMDESNSKVFDKSVANALANDNIDTNNLKLKGKN
tara:strand:+ start:83 stop:700 length:618 start_codon:yes stop_codon:yes gene_type:complete